MTEQFGTNQNISVSNGNVEDGKQSRPLIIADAEYIKEHFGQLRHLFFGFSAVHIETMLVVCGNADVDFDFLKASEIVEYPVLYLPFIWKQNYSRLVERLGKFKPTVVHCFGVKRSRLAKMLAADLNLPSVISLSRNFGHSRMLKNTVGFDAIVIPSESAAEKARKKRSRISHLINVVPNGTFVDERRSCFSEPGQLTSIVLVDKLDSMKRFEPLLLALRHLAVDGYEFLMVFMGDGKARSGISEFIKSVGLSNRINITEVLHPLRSVFQGADIYIQVASAGDYNAALIEAAGAGLAVAASKVDMGKFLKPNQTAVFFDADDELSIYSCLQKLFDDREMARGLADSIQEHLRINNSVSDMVDSMLEVYEKI